MLFSYFNYLLKAQNEYRLHSPFVFKLYTEIIKPFKWYYIFGEIEAIRRSLLNNSQVIEIQDFGAGSRVHSSNQRAIKQIAKYSNTSPKQGQLLFKLVDFFQPKTILELGTSLGISTLYLAGARTNAQIYTFEGCSQTAQIAKKNFEKLRINNIQTIVGNLDETLAQKLTNIPQIDWVLFDANHRFEPTMRYFELCLAKSHQESVFVFDDIHWSSEMEKAWEQIKKHPGVSLSIDLFSLGLIFLNPQLSKQNFTLKL